MGSYLSHKQPNTNTNAESYYTNLVSNQIAENTPKEQVQITISLTNCSTYYPYVIAVLISDESGMFRMVGKTNDEYANNNGVINFNITFAMDYFFEREQNIVMNIGKNNSTFSVKTSLGRIMGSRQRTLILPISGENNQNNPEKLTIYGKTTKNNNMNVGFRITAEFLKNTNIFFIIKKIVSSPNEKFGINVYKSEVKQVTNGRATFNDVKIPSNVLCSGEYDSLISIEFHDFSAQTKIGEHETTVNQLFSNDKKLTMNDLHSNYLLKAAVKCDLIKEYTFLDYIVGGVQIALTVGIDFTGSNGNPTSPNSLHYITSSGHNSYEKAIRSCGDIVAYYDYDQLFPVYGYGAQIKGTYQVSHCFPINFNANDPNIQTIDGVLGAYRNVLQSVTLSGPTYFAPLINKFISDVKLNNNRMVYNILMILTDGMINDMDNTIDALVEASFMPISVIIIGIGKADFGNMDVLDADESPLVDKNGRKSARDLVQFVPFYKFENDGAKLAEQVLEEVPRQLVEFYRMMNIPPGEKIM